MARFSNKGKAIAYAAEHGIILTVEARDNFDGDYTVEVWSHDSHLSEPNSYCHTYFARGNTEPRAWADALAYMQRLTECPADCSCRDHTDQDQDQDQDQNRDQDPKTRRPSRAMSALDTLRTTLNAGPTIPPRPRRHDQHNGVNVWVCDCCALLVENGDDSSCRDYYNHTHPRCDSAITYLTGVTFTVVYFANCNGCGTIQRTGATMYGAIRPAK